MGKAWALFSGSWTFTHHLCAFCMVLAWAYFRHHRFSPLPTAFSLYLLMFQVLLCMKNKHGTGQLYSKAGRSGMGVEHIYQSNFSARLYNRTLCLLFGRGQDHRLPGWDRDRGGVDSLMPSSSSQWRRDLWPSPVISVSPSLSLS